MCDSLDIRLLDQSIAHTAVGKWVIADDRLSQCQALIQTEGTFGVIDDAYYSDCLPQFEDDNTLNWASKAFGDGNLLRLPVASGCSFSFGSEYQDYAYDAGTSVDQHFQGGGFAELPLGQGFTFAMPPSQPEDGEMDSCAYLHHNIELL